MASQKKPHSNDFRSINSQTASKAARFPQRTIDQIQEIITSLHQMEKTGRRERDE